jgi:hypothetical protein
LSEKEKEDQINKLRDTFYINMKNINIIKEKLDIKLKELSAISTPNLESNAPSKGTKPIIYPIQAFVTFIYASDRKLAVEKYNHYSLVHLCCGNKELLLKEKYHIKVVPAPEPSVIIWENIEFTKTERFGRKILSFLLSLLCIVASLTMIFSSKYLQQRAANNGSNEEVSCPENFDSYAPIDQYEIVQEYPTLLQCYCYSSSALSYDSSICNSFFRTTAEAQVLTYFASFMVLVVNQLIQYVVRFSARFEKHHTRDGMSMSVFLRLFLLKYINTAAVFLINNNNIILKKIFSLDSSTDTSSSSSSVEFDATWYTSVGITVVLVQLGDAFNAQATNIYNYYHLEKTKQRAKEHPELALTQDELNKLHVGPEFEFAYNYAQVMSTFFVCLTFSTGIPILYPIAAFNFLFFYLMEKYMFIHLYKIPPHFTTLVGHRATLLIPAALLLHISMSIWMIGNNSLFEEQNDTGSNTTLVGSLQFGAVIRDKITGHATFPLFMTFVAIVALHLLYYYYDYSKKTLHRVS